MRAELFCVGRVDSLAVPIRDPIRTFPSIPESVITKSSDCSTVPKTT
jgi:hypothetical protein